MVEILEPVGAPEPRPPRRGLVASSEDVTSGTEWVAGFSYMPESCDPAVAFPMFCDIPADPADAAKPIPDNPGRVDFRPFLVIGADECRTGMPPADRLARARRQLLATESFAIEREFWSGAIATDQDLPNRFLARAGNDPDGAPFVEQLDPATPVEALATLERALSECLSGRSGMIHVTEDTATRWAAHGLLRSEGGLLLTLLDSIVVVGGGYLGTSPAGLAPAAGAWAYGTGRVYLRRGAISPADDGDVNARYDRSVNRQTVIVERPVGIAVDGCCTVGVNVLPDE